MSSRAYAILVTGLPGSGKTTIAKQLSAELGIPYILLDDIRESLANTPGTEKLTRLELTYAAARVVWSMLPGFTTGVVIDAWLNLNLDHRQHIKQAIDKFGTQLLEIHCQVPVEVAINRYLDRHSQSPRHGIHKAGDDAVKAINAASEKIQPLHLGPTFTADTTTPVDLEPIKRWIKTELKSTH